MALSHAQVLNRCLVHGGSRACRYLYLDNSFQSYHCMKLVPARRRYIDKRVNEYIKDMQSKGRDPFQTYGLPIGDGGNCSGYLYLPTVLQGYDVKP